LFARVDDLTLADVFCLREDKFN